MTTTKLAIEFSRLLGKELGELMDDVIAENRAQPEYCSSHDYCDANMIMAEAFENTYGRFPIIEPMGGDMDLMNEAWDKAKQSDFYTND